MNQPTNTNSPFTDTGLQTTGAQNIACTTTSGLASDPTQFLSREYPQHTTNIVHMQLPTEIIRQPVAVHEQIRRERVEEIQPVVNIEKFNTQVIQITQPLYDREIRPTGIEERVLPSQVLPDVIVPTRDARLPFDVSTVRYLDERGMVVEKPAIFQEIDKDKIIEEIQPVIYKETIVPSLIHETKPVFQKIVEGTTYVHETLPPLQFNQSQYRDIPLPTTPIVQQPLIIEQPRVVEVPKEVPKVVEKKVVEKPKHFVEETTTTTTTTVIPNILPTK